MAINFYNFRCRSCGKDCPFAGRKKLREGWVCAKCQKGGE